MKSLMFGALKIGQVWSPGFSRWRSLRVEGYPSSCIAPAEAGTPNLARPSLANQLDQVAQFALNLTRVAHGVSDLFADQFTVVVAQAMDGHCH